MIFNKQKLIEVNFTIKSNDSIELPTSITTNKTLFEKLLQKFRFIEEICIKFDANNSYKIFDAVLNNCNYLKKISSSGDVSDNEVMEKFGRVCGQKLKFIYENSGEEQNLMKIFELTPNLETIYFCYRNYNLSDLQIKSDMSDFINEFSRFEKLEKLIIRIVITDSNIGNANLLNPNAKGLIWI